MTRPNMLKLAHTSSKINLTKVLWLQP